MMLSDLWMIWALPLVAFLGYTSHRASLCTVRAVADLLEFRRFARFGGFLRAVCWAMLLTLPASYFFPERFPLPVMSVPLWSGLLGGFLFGLGAALNSGCSFSTLQRLADADWRMLATLAGFMGGSAVLHALPSIPVMPHDPEIAQLPAWLAPAMVMLLAWAVLELVLLKKGGFNWRERLTAEHYSPATTALILGLGAALLYLGMGSWTYSNTLQASVGAFFGKPDFPALPQLLLIPALFAGMMISAWQRGAWRIAKKISGGWRNLSGGLLMGIGGSLIPGGNDTLLLHHMPALASDSLWTYLMLIFGVAAGLLAMRRDRIVSCHTCEDV